MSQTTARPSFASGEINPAFWGRTDQAKFHSGCSVMRNSFVNYRGGTASRAGTAFVGPCLQNGTALPPRLIPFRFSIQQSYVLEFGDQYMRVISQGAYITETPLNILGIASTWPLGMTLPLDASTWKAGDMFYVSGMTGLLALNNLYFVVLTNPVIVGSSCLVSVADMFGNSYNGLSLSGWTGGGTAAKIYTQTTPYSAVDLPFLKFTQSADVMSLTCVNQNTLTEYPPYDLTRYSSNNWVFVQTNYASSILPPTACTATASTLTPVTSGQQLPTKYAYCVTAVDSITGQESVASPIAYVLNSVDIALYLGSITINWPPVNTAGYYNIYKAPSSYNTDVPIGSVFGYAGTSFGNQFVDSNITQDFTRTPPVHVNPFARGMILNAVITSQGSGYTQATVGANVITNTGSGAVITPIIVGGVVVDCIVQNSGENYTAGDSLVITDSGSGAGAVASLTIGPQTGTYPSVVSYFQSRRVYANSLNNPDGYQMSQTGAYTNMDAASPPIASDAISGNPWGLQVNGIQWLQPMPGGLVVGTGLDAWQLSGANGNGSAITPASQSATPQASNGFSQTVPPVKINYDILHLQPLGSVVISLQYNFFAQIYAGTDISFLSSHLLENHQIKEWAWAKEPYKLLWAVRDDGKALSLTYLKEQEINGWARHDTNGLFQSVVSIVEPPIDAIYFIVKRYIRAYSKWAYYVERMDNRLWVNTEDPWCVDCGLASIQGIRNANLSASSASGSGSVLTAFVINGGTGYSNPSLIITDPSGSGHGAIVKLQTSVTSDFNSDFNTDFGGNGAFGGSITSAVVVNGGSSYSRIQVKLQDPTGHGGAVGLTIDRSITFTADQPVFTSADVGSVIRMSGGIGTVITFVNAFQVICTMSQNITLTISNDPYNTPAPAPYGDWTITTPLQTITNLQHLEGLQVTALADGNVVSGLTVTNGTVELPNPATAITIGLPFVAQVQTLHLDIAGGHTTIQGKRKRISGMTVRMDKSRGVFAGANQPTASTTPYQAETIWNNLQEIKERDVPLNNSHAIPLFTGDRYLPIDDDWNMLDGEASPGFLAVQQINPLPMNVLLLAPTWESGDSDDQVG